MIIIEVLASKLADRIAVQQGLDKEKQSVIKYGLIGLLQVVTLLIIIIFIGVITNSLYESLIIFLSVGFMRKSTGGAHSKTMGGCNTLSIISISLLALLSRYLFANPINSNINYGITLMIYALGYLIFYLRVPVDSPNKPIVKQEKIRRLRKQSFIKLTLFLLLTVGAIYFAESNNRLNSISSSIRIAILWHTLTLTEFGIIVLASLDSIVTRILGKLKFV